MSAVKYMWPTVRLHSLLTQPGGQTRTQALEGAAEALNECLDMAMEGMSASLAGIDAILDTAGARGLTREETYSILQHAERLASIATPFEWPVLSHVTASLGELGAALLDAESRPSHPVIVHARAARWAAENPRATEDDAAPMLAGLRRVAIRYGAPVAQAHT